MRCSASGCMRVSNAAGPSGSDVIESGAEPRFIRKRLAALALSVYRRLITRRVLLIGLLAMIGFAVAAAGMKYRQRVSAEDRISLATAPNTGVSVDLATRTLLFDLVIDNRSPYAVRLDGLSVATPGLSVVPDTAINGDGATALPARLPREDQFVTTLRLRPDCRNALPGTPAFRLVATSSSGHRHVIALPPFGPLAQLWAESVRSACFDNAE